MKIADVTLVLFTFCNTVRFVAYVPQIIRAVRDRSGAEAISFGTWGLFLVSHASAMAYALVNNQDWVMASMFLGNAVGCGAILLIAAWKRSQHGSSKRRVEQCIDMTGDQPQSTRRQHSSNDTIRESPCCAKTTPINASAQHEH
jgi:PQ loop repeat